MSAPSATSSAPPGATSTGSSGGGGGGPTSSPLLFFVALGFGVVFTNLWIIVGVKYCFRYNQRNRMARNDENGEPIDMTAMPRAHRRRREKKLMAMDEVNERFPVMKYKAWISSRADEGLPTAGGVALPASRAPSIKDAEGVIDPSKETDHVENVDSSAPTSSHPHPESEKSTEGNPPSSDPIAIIPSQSVEQSFHAKPLIPDSKTSASKVDETDHENEIRDDAEAEAFDDDQIQIAVPTEMLEHPGDACAICIETLEDEDDVRGLTCGHAFHASCVDPWLTNRRACCPLCKADYFIPKPRPEGEAASETDRTAGRRAPTAWSGARIDMPHPPQYAFMMGSRNGRPRMILPGRFMTISRDSPNDRYGFPSVQRIPRSQRHQNNESQDDAQLANASTEANRSGGWMARVRFPRPSLPNGLWRNNTPANSAVTPDGSSNVGTSATNTTPGQLEAGTR